MNRYIVLIYLIFLPAVCIYPQNSSLLIPPELKEKYNGGTRSWDGRPGKSYWQNSADYKIKTELEPLTGKINGEAAIIYYNNSPDTLKDIVIFLYNNIYKKGAARGHTMNADAIYEGMKISSLKFNGTDFENRNVLDAAATVLYVPGIQPVSPGGQLTVNVVWECTLPLKSPLRMGRNNNGSAFAAYWFPRIGVYDDIDGWDVNEYTGPAEFYNDFGNFDVEISVPGNYLVWATGILQNADELLSDEILTRYSKSWNSDQVIRIVSKDDYLKGKPLTRNEVNTWRFRAENVTDFSFACAENYLWDGSIINIDGRKIFVDAAYPEDAPYYDLAAEYSKNLMEFASENLPGVPYPYPKFTTFCNGWKIYGGMETPMMANNMAPGEWPMFITLIAHEMWHTYFPFYVGTNEKKYAWMDEGWMSYFPKFLFPEYDSTFNYLVSRKSRPILPSTEYDIPPMAVSSSLSWLPLAQSSYLRTLYALHSLSELMGMDLFKKALKEYMRQWEWKHPVPYDFFFTFDRIAGEDMGWFWKPWFFEFGYTDLALREGSSDGEIEVLLEGNQPVPVRLRLEYDDNSSEVIKESPAVWKNLGSFTIKGKNGKKIKRAEIITDEIDDKNSANDVIIFNKNSN